MQKDHRNASVQTFSSSSPKLLTHKGKLEVLYGKFFIQLNKTSVGWHLKREKNIRNIIKI